MQIPLSHIQIPLSLSSILLQTRRPDKLEENLLGQLLVRRMKRMKLNMEGEAELHLKTDGKAELQMNTNC